MAIGLDTAYYNYYNVKGRYSPETPQMPAWKRTYEVVDDRIEGNNRSQDCDAFRAAVKLEETYYAVSVSNRAKYKNADELRQALSQKYLFGDAYSQYTRTERNAMYQNELNMTMFGCLSGCGNMDDPHLGGPVYGTTDEEVSAYNRQMVNTQINNIFSQAGINSSSLGNISFSIEPYTHALTVNGVDDANTSRLIEQLLNKDNNASELFYHVLQSSSARISDDVKIKYHAIRDFKDITGLDLRMFSQTKDGFVDADGRNPLDIYKKALEATNRVPANFKGAALEVFTDKMMKLHNEDFASIPDMNLMIGFSDGKLQDSVFNSAIMRGLDIIA